MSKQTNLSHAPQPLTSFIFLVKSVANCPVGLEFKYTNKVLIFRVDPSSPLSDLYNGSQSLGSTNTCDLYNRASSCSSGYGSSPGQDNFDVRALGSLGMSSAFAKEAPGVKRIHQWLKISDSTEGHSKKLLKTVDRKETTKGTFSDGSKQKNPEVLCASLNCKKKKQRCCLSSNHSVHLSSCKSVRSLRRRSSMCRKKGHSRRVLKAFSCCQKKSSYNRIKHMKCLRRDKIQISMRRSHVPVRQETIPKRYKTKPKIIESELTYFSPGWPSYGSKTPESLWIEENRGVLGEDMTGSLEKESRLASCCKFLCFLLLLSSFVTVIILVSVFLNKGPN